MQPAAYRTFTRDLERRLADDARVLGLVALGSMVDQDYAPDRWSDHDFLVIVRSGDQEQFRADLAWLPAHERIVLAFRETAHGLNVLYDDAHLLELAVFDTQELYLAQVNRYRVLIDRGGIQQHLEAIADDTARRNDSSSANDAVLFGQFLANPLVGIGRYRRGERLSGRAFVKTHVLRNLLLLLERHLPSPQKSLLDAIEPLRRFESTFPALGQELNNILEQPTPLAASRLLALAERELKECLHDYPSQAVAVIAGQLR